MPTTTLDRPDHDTDFHAWALDQAERLRAIARTRPNEPIDWELLAEEVEDMGRSDLRGARSLLRLVIVHFLKIDFGQNDEPVRHWRAEAKAFRAHLNHGLTPSISARLRAELQETYRIAALDAVAALWDDPELEARLPRHCPYSFDQLTGDWLPERAKGE